MLRWRPWLGVARGLCTDAKAAYPVGFTKSIALPEFKRDWEHLPSGARETNTLVRVAGRVTACREASSKLLFYDIASGGHKIQVLADRKYYVGKEWQEYDLHSSSDAVSDDQREVAEAAFGTIHKQVRRGDIIGIVGFPGKSGKGQLSVIPLTVELLAPCRRELPSSVKEVLTNPDIRFRRRYVDMLMNPLPMRALQVRATVLRALRQFLHDRGHIEVETPVLGMMAGGASARPFETRLHALGGLPLTLRVAPELYLKQLIVGGCDRIFEVGKCFRNEGVDASHNPEFTMCEFYEAYQDYHGLMGVTEALLAHLATEVTGSARVAVTVHRSVAGNDGREEAEEGGQGEGREGDEGEESIVDVDFSGPYRRLPIVQTLEEGLGAKLPVDVNHPASLPELLRLCGYGKDSSDSSEGIMVWGKSHPPIKMPAPHTNARVLDRLVEAVIEPLCQQPTFITDHPVCMSPLARQHRGDAALTERFELFVLGREICNAYSELNDPDEQRRRFQSQQQDKAAGDVEAHPMDANYCDALEYGLPPTGGFGLGIDRLVMMFAGAHHIREVLMFPTMKPKQPEVHPESDGAAPSGDV